MKKSEENIKNNLSEIYSKSLLSEMFLLKFIVYENNDTSVQKMYK